MRRCETARPRAVRSGAARKPRKDRRPSGRGASCGRDQASSLVRHFLFGDVDSIPAVVLGVVESGVRARNKRVDCRDGVVGYSGADAHGRANCMGGDGCAGRLEARADAFGDFARAFDPTWDDRYKFFATEPADDVVDTCAGAHDPTEKAQRIIANGVTKAVID